MPAQKYRSSMPEQVELLAEKSTCQLPLELDRVVLELVRKLRRRLSAEGSMLKLEIDHIEPARVRGDEENVREDHTYTSR